MSLRPDDVWRVRVERLTALYEQLLSRHPTAVVSLRDVAQASPEGRAIAETLQDVEQDAAADHFRELGWRVTITRAGRLAGLTVAHPQSSAQRAESVPENPEEARADHRPFSYPPLLEVAVGDHLDALAQSLGTRRRLFPSGSLESDETLRTRLIVIATEAAHRGVAPRPLSTTPAERVIQRAARFIFSRRRAPLPSGYSPPSMDIDLDLFRPWLDALSDEDVEAFAAQLDVYAPVEARYLRQRILAAIVAALPPAHPEAP